VVEYTPAATVAALAATAGSGQSATVGTNFATNLGARATDSNGSPVSGALATFSAPTSGASGSFIGGSPTPSVTTGSDGVATAPILTANATAGSFQVTAAVAGGPAPAAFSLTNNPAPPPSTPTAVDVANTYIRSDAAGTNHGLAQVLIGRTSPEIDS
jgi:hypothetical protein